MNLVGVVADTEGVGEHVRYIALLLDTLKQVRKGAGREHGHIAPVVKGLLLVDGRVLNVVGRLGAVGAHCWVSARLVITWAVAVDECCVGYLSGVLFESAKAQDRVTSWCKTVDGERAIWLGGRIRELGIGYEEID